jgi:Tfp pilus assembly protein PilX
MPNNVMTRSFRDERGMALVMAMIVLVILSCLVIAFSLLSGTEPTIAANQLRVAQARALAEAGLERAAWALTAGKKCEATSPTPAGCPTGLTYTSLGQLPAVVPAPYDGSQLLTVSAGDNIGGVRVTVSAGSTDRERNVVAVGWVPTDDTTDAHTKAHQKVSATLMTFAAPNLPCAVCVRGDIQIGGSSTIDSRADTSCGSKYGTWSTTVKDSSGNIISPGNTVIGSGASKVYGAVDGNNTANQSTDMAVHQNQADFDAKSFTTADLNALKAYAKASGTYYQGNVTFNASNKMADNKIYFVDTVSGNNITSSTPTSDYASVSVNGNASVNSAGFHGWLIVNGSASVSGNVKMFGLLYAQNDLSYTGTGTGQIVGQMVSANVKDTIATVIDTSLAGNSSVSYNCADADGNGILPNAFIIKAGTYKECAGSDTASSCP